MTPKAMKSPILLAALLASAVHQGFAETADGIQVAPSTKVPKITIFKADKTNGFYSDDFRIFGRIQGSCLHSAGIFNGDTQIHSIPLTNTDSSKASHDFRLTIDAAVEPEIRAVSCSGATSILKIDVLNYRG